MEPDRTPQVKGVVIITLPPADNPSLGKTITAFTVSNSVQSQQGFDLRREEQENRGSQNNQYPVNLPIQSPPEYQFRLSFGNLFHGGLRKLVAIVGVSLFAVMFYSSLFPTTIQELRRSKDENGPKSFLFPLYHKFDLSAEMGVHLKLGRFVDVDKENVMVLNRNPLNPSEVNKFVSSAEKVDSSTIFPVKGNVYPDGLYYTYILVGNPPRPYFLDMDTGSDLTWIQCNAPCTSCAKGRHPLYEPKRSNIVSPKHSLCVEIQRKQNGGYCETCRQCDYEIQYADESSSLGVLTTDELHLVVSNGSLSKLNVIFGCAYDQQGSLLSSLSKTDGILGLSRAKVGLLSQLDNQGIINNVLGHCLTFDAAGGGHMFMGDDFVPQWGMAWVPMLNIPSIDFYHAKITKIYYGSSPLNGVGQSSLVRQLVFDTGSSYTYFTKQAYSDLVASLDEVSLFGLVQDSSDSTLPVCWRAEFPIRSVSDVKQFFKPLNLLFGSRFWIVSTKFEIPPDGYLVVSNKGNICLGILDGSAVHDGSNIILGDISLRGKLVVYDNVNQKIGWTESRCSKPQPRKTNSLHLPFFL